MPNSTSGSKTPSHHGSNESLTLTVPTNTSAGIPQGTLPGDTKEVNTRSKSPNQLSTELRLKYKTQLNRVASIDDIARSIPENALDANLGEVLENLAQLEDFHQEFTSVHSSFELTWPAAFLDHPYFKENLHQTEARIYRKAKLALGRLKHELTGALQVAPTQSPHEARFESKLPDISLPSFSGEYVDWPAFQEMFTCLILDNERLTNVERLHYLRSCMTGAPAQLIANFPLVGTSLQPSWEMLANRFENKRLLIQAQLDKMCHLEPLKSKSAKGLTALITTVTEAHKALESLGVTDLGDHMLTYHVSRHLDRTTRGAWENSLGSSTEYPQFTQLESFVNTRARALERIEAAPASAQPTRTTQVSQNQPHVSRKTSTAHSATVSDTTQRSTQSQPSSNFHCDCCDGNHFVVVCPKFRELDVPARRKLAEKQRLCYNCLGRHSAHSCKSTKGCKHCSSRHHTMLHSNIPRTTQQGNSRTIEPVQSTSSAPQ